MVPIALKGVEEAVLKKGLVEVGAVAGVVVVGGPKEKGLLLSATAGVAPAFAVLNEKPGVAAGVVVEAGFEKSNIEVEGLDSVVGFIAAVLAKKLGMAGALVAGVGSADMLLVLLVAVGGLKKFVIGAAGVVVAGAGGLNENPGLGACVIAGSVIGSVAVLVIEVVLGQLNKDGVGDFS